MKKKIFRFLRNLLIKRNIRLNNELIHVDNKVLYYEDKNKSEDFYSKLEESANLKKEKIREKIEANNIKIADHNAKLLDEENDNKNLLDETKHIVIDNVSMHFSGLKAVDQVSFDVNRGEVFGIIGPNGAGKTTLFNCITQFYDPTLGNIYFNNKFNETINLNHFKPHQIISQGLARTFQNIELIWELSVLENLLVGAHSEFTSGIFGHLFKTRRNRIDEFGIRHKALTILKRLNLENYAQAYPIGLPYGILKKIELARSLMTNPELVILDEPAAGLNENETIEFAKSLLEIRKEFDLTILLVEHDMGLVMEVCDRICAISFGRTLAIGTPEEIQSNELVKTAYLGGD